MCSGQRVRPPEGSSDFFIEKGPSQASCSGTQCPSVSRVSPRGSRWHPGVAQDRFAWMGLHLVPYSTGPPRGHGVGAATQREREQRELGGPGGLVRHEGWRLPSAGRWAPLSHRAWGLSWLQDGVCPCWRM